MAKVHTADNGRRRNGRDTSPRTLCRMPIRPHAPYRVTGDPAEATCTRCHARLAAMSGREVGNV